MSIKINKLEIENVKKLKLKELGPSCNNRKRG